MGELALRRRGNKGSSFYQLSTTNISMTKYQGLYYDYKNPVGIGNLTPTIKSGRFTADASYGRANDNSAGGGSTTVSNKHYWDAMALFSIEGYLLGNYVDRDGSFLFRSCIPSTAGVLLGADASCTLKAPVVFWAIDSQKARRVYAEGDMIFDVSFGTDANGAKILVFDWTFEGTFNGEVTDRIPYFNVSVDIVEGE